MTPRRLDGKVAFVTGAGGGIGRAIVARLADEGAAVAVTDLDETAARECANAITTSGGRAIAIAFDVSDHRAAADAAARAERELGAIDILVNNAGWDVVKPFVETGPELWDKLIAINYRGVLNCCAALAPKMQNRGAGGKIISISSDAARVGSTGEAVYAGCKAAIIGFSKTLARELARDRINVNVICPGPTDTALLRTAMAGREGVLDAMARNIPMRRIGQPADLAGAVAFFASSDSDFATGQVLSVSGGLTMAG